MSDTTQSDMAPAEEPQSEAVVGKPEPRSKGPVWRRTLAWVFLVLGLILVPLAVTGGWVRGNIFSTDGFVSMVGPLASDPAIQDQIATSLTNQIFNALDLEVRLQNVLPNGLGFLAGPVEDRLKARTLQGAQALVATDEFATVWTKAVTGVHGAVVGFLNGTGNVYLGNDGTITLDLSTLSTRLVDRLAQAGIEISPRSDRYWPPGRCRSPKWPDSRRSRAFSTSSTSSSSCCLSWRCSCWPAPLLSRLDGRGRPSGSASG